MQTTSKRGAGRPFGRALSKQQRHNQNAPLRTGIKLNRAYEKAWLDMRRYLVLKGGAGSGKSVFCAQKVLHRCVSEYLPSSNKLGRPAFAHRFLVLRKVAATRKNSVFELLCSTLEKMGTAHEWQINLTAMSLVHLRTGAAILTAGVDDVEKLKSIADITGIWMEEATEFSQDDFLQIDLRMRGIYPFAQQIILSFNPVSKSHWIAQQFDSPHGAYVDRTYTGLYKTTWRHNRFINADYGARMANLCKVDENMARIYDRGDWGIEDPESLFAWRFRSETHVSPRARYNPYLGTVWVFFDFNIAASAIICQKYDHGAYILKEYHHTTGDLQSLVSEIRNDLHQMKADATPAGQSFYDDYLIVGGDASGGARSGLVADRLTAFQQLAQFFGEGAGNPLPWEHFNVPAANPAHSSSRLVTNMVLKNEPNFLINPGCVALIHDLENVKFLKGSIDKSDPKLTHLLDCFRYFVWAELSGRLERYGLEDIVHKFGISERLSPN
jgi:PBSX family phage terminase large subunit